jgi:hypothetical protein
LDGVSSELVVPADHITIHRHPRTILELQRILLEHLGQIRTHAIRRLPSPFGGVATREADTVLNP